MGVIVWRGRRAGRRPGELTQKIAGLGIGEQRLVIGSKDHVRALIKGERGWFRVNCPERRFDIGRLDSVRTLVRRLADIERDDWRTIWEAGSGVEAGIDGVSSREAMTIVPAAHGFARWAWGAGLGRLIMNGRWWVWTHPGGWKTQRGVMVCLRNAGVPCRRMADRS